MTPLPYLQPLVVALLAASLCGCVISPLPVFADKEGAADSKFTGKFKIEGLVGDERPTGFMADAVPETFEVLQKGNQYLVVENGKLKYLATLHPLGETEAIVQLWRTGATSSDFLYILVRWNSRGLALRELDCDPSDPGTNECRAKTKEDVVRFAEFTESNFTKYPNRILLVRRQD